MGAACGAEAATEEAAAKNAVAAKPIATEPASPTNRETAMLAAKPAKPKDPEKIFDEKSPVSWDDVPEFKAGNPVVYCIVEVSGDMTDDDEEYWTAHGFLPDNGDWAARLDFELFAHAVPKTVENFRCMITGEKGKHKQSGKAMTFAGSKIHRIESDFMLQGGDFIDGSGSGKTSIYGYEFPDEDLFWCDHGATGLLSSANMGPDTNGTQFFCTFKPKKGLNGKHVVFGQITENRREKNELVLEAINKVVGSPGGRCLRNINIKKCDVYPEKKFKKREAGWVPEGCQALEKPQENGKKEEDKKEEDRKEEDKNEEDSEYVLSVEPNGAEQ